MDSRGQKERKPPAPGAPCPRSPCPAGSCGLWGRSHPALSPQDFKFSIKLEFHSVVQSLWPNGFQNQPFPLKTASF